MSEDYQSTAQLIRDRYEKLSGGPRKSRFRIQVNPSVQKAANMKRAKSNVIFKSVNSPKLVPPSITSTTPKPFKSRRKKDDEWVRPNPLVESSPTVKLAHQLRLAVHLGKGSINPDNNPQLRNILREVWELGYPQEEVHRILRQCTLGTNKLNAYKLQVRYRKNIFLILTVQVGQLLSAKKKLIPILKDFNASFQFAMDLFKNVGLIEAFIKPTTPFNFDDFETLIRRDAWDCKARALEVIDYQTGSVCFSCNPLYLLNVANSLKAKGYEVVYTENGYRANLLVDLNWLERSTYTKFVEKLYGVNEITHIYDNVRSIDLPYEPVFNTKS